MRWDATENKIFSLSESTHKILDKSHDKITLTFYTNTDLIKNTPNELKTYSKRIYDLLKEYAAYGKGRISLKFIKPQTDSDEADTAIAYGLKGINLPNGDTLFMGLVAKKMDKEEIIPFFDPEKEDKLEYEITRTISRLQTDKKAIIGIISSLNIFGTPSYMGKGSPAWHFITTTKKEYEVKRIDEKDKKLPKDINALICFQPKKLNEDMVKGIEKFVENGGSLVVMADPMAIIDPQSSRGIYKFPLDKTLNKWGLSFSAPKAIADIKYSTRIMGRNNQPELNPGWLSIKKDTLDKKDIITSDLASLLFPIAGSFNIKKQKGLKYENLVSSSTASALFDSAFLNMGGINAIKNSFKSDGKEKPIAVKISGQFKKGGKKGVVIAIGDVDFLFDQFYMRTQNFLGFQVANMFNDNLVFFQNLVEILCGQKELIDIRSRTTTMRPFIVVQKLEEQAKEKWLEQEKELSLKAEETNKKLRALEKNSSGQNLVLNKQQEKELKEFREEKVRIDKELKKVRRNLRKDIENLGVKIKLLNIFGIPFIIALAGIIIGVKRKKNSN